METPYLQINVFVLIDPGKSFDETNRNYLRQMNFGAISEDDVQFYQETIKTVEPLIPFSWWNDDLPYFQIKYSNINEYSKYFDNQDTCIRFIKQNLKDINPEEIIKKQTKQYKSDADYGYLEQIGDLYLNYQQRHQLEQENPFVYAQYEIKHAYGCQHHLRGAYIYCDQCEKAYGCIKCHNAVILDHDINDTDINQVVCCQCNLHQQISGRCTKCKNIFANHYCEICKTIVTLDDETEPCFHCDKCNKCHFNCMQILCRNCENCGECMQTKHIQNHICKDQEINCLICCEQLDSNQDFVTLPCNDKHKLHDQCYNKYFYQNYKSNCPLCKQSIVNSINKLQIQLNILQLIKLTKIKMVMPLFEIQCIDCKRNCITLNQPYCRHCYNYNVDQVFEMMITKMQWIKFLKRNNDTCITQHIEDQYQKMHISQLLQEFRSDIRKYPTLYKNYNTRFKIPFLVFYLCGILFFLMLWQIKFTD